jgi:gamma-glutamyltranspeptidase/glutathione hydrolase
MQKKFTILISFIILFITNSLQSMVCLALPFKSSQIIMSAENQTAINAAQSIAEKGGNAVDVAVSLALALSVTNPTFASLGGGGFAMVKMGKMIEVLDFRERAPSAAGPKYFLGKSAEDSVNGGTAIAIPGTPHGLWTLHKKYGKLHWSQLFDAPILLAQKGVRVSGEYSEDLTKNALRFTPSTRQLFLKSGTTAYLPGEIFVQKNLARLLSEMRNRNITSFYSGMGAKDIVDSVQKAGGEITLKDLEDYKSIWREPIIAEYAGYKLYLMPPPSSGGIIIKTALELIEKLNLNKYPERGVDELHLLGQILNRSFRARNLISDSDYNEVPTDNLFSKKYLEELAQSIQIKEATQMPGIEVQTTPKESNDTTHISVMDKFGNAVAMTLTLNGKFGSGVATEKYGVMLNNEMDDFTTRPGEANMFGLVQGQTNTVAPGKRPVSSMSPTLVEKDKKIVMALGAPGGPRIISSLIQVLYRTLGRGNNLEVAVEAPRVHQQYLPNKLFLDENRFTPETIDALKGRKNIIETSWQGRVFAVRLINDILEGVADTRSEGAVGGF